MGQRLEPEQLALYKRIDKILWSDWDPAEVNSIQEARDEYYCYLFPLLNLVTDQATTDQISDYLYHIETKNMLLLGNKKRCDKVAKLIKVNSKKILSSL